MKVKKLSITLPARVPRAKLLNQALRNLACGKMSSPSDFNRQRDKLELKKQLRSEDL